MKLNKGKIHRIIREKKKGVTTSEIEQDMKITPRRVQRIWKYYVATKIELVIGNDVGRPKNPSIHMRLSSSDWPMLVTDLGCG